MSVILEDRNGIMVSLGSSKAIVIDNRDPLNKGRIKVLSPVYGETNFIYWTAPDDGFYSPPDIGSIVHIEAGNGEKDFLYATRVILDGEDSDPDTPTQFRREVPTNRGWVSPGDLSADGTPAAKNAGHAVELDDGIATVDASGVVTQTKESKGVRLSTSGGHKLNMAEEEGEGSQQNRVEVSSTGGQAVQLIDDNDAEKQQVIVKDADGRTIEIIKEADRIRLRNQSGTIFIDIDIANDTIEIDANNVKLGTNAGEAIVRGDTFRQLFNSHYHQTGTGPTSPPVVQMDPSSANTHLSDKHTVE